MRDSSTHSRRPRAVRLLLAAVCALAVAAGVPGVALADAPNPNSITLVSLVGNPDGSRTLTVRGTWDWGAGGPCDSGNDKKAVGYAIDWNDVKQPGNVVASGIDVGTITPTDNLVRPANNVNFVVCTTNSGSWGPLSHTYAAGTPLPATVCAVTYDVHLENGQVKNATGSHSTTAGGANHNTDNSVEENALISGGNCQGLVLSTPVTFRSATAQKVGKGVHVRWQTASEIQVLGYNVYVERNGKRVKLNAKLIRTKGPAGGSYLFKASVPKGKFWLQTVNTDGSRLWRFVRAS